MDIMKKRNKDIMSRSGKTSGSKDNMRRVNKDIMRQWGKDIKDIVCNSMAIKNLMCLRFHNSHTYI